MDYEKLEVSDVALCAKVITDAQVEKCVYERIFLLLPS